MATWGPTASGGRSVVSVQATTEAGPPADGDGVNVNDVGGFDLVVEADEGQTLSGTGELVGYRQHESGWAFAKDSAVTIDSSANGQRRIVFTGWTVANPRGFVAHLANGVGVSAGGLRLYYYCTTLRGVRA